MLTSTADLEGAAAGGAAVIDCRPFAEYARGHVPGAVNLDAFAFHWYDTTERGLAELARQSARLLSFCGVAAGRPAIAYDGRTGMLAARVAWLLEYNSHPDASVLDGGLEKWRAEGRPVEEGTNAPAPGGLEPRPDPSVAAGAAGILDGLGSAVLVDARTPAEYSGAVARAARAGHIPGAVNVDYELNLAADGTLKGAAELARLYPFPRDSPVVAYCHGGYRAAVTYAALRRAGFADVRLYPGSWGEWGNLPGMPAER